MLLRWPRVGSRSPSTPRSSFFTGERTTVTDAVGATWRTGDIYQTSVLVTIYGMSFLALLALLRIAQRHTAVTGVTTEVRATRRAEADPARLSA